MKNLILIPLFVLSLIGCNQQSTTFGDENSPPPAIDNSPPVLTLLGNLQDPNFVLEIEFGSTYEDYGVEAIDPEDGDITDSIFLDLSQVDFSALGTYPVTYSITDSSGNTTTATRNIKITDTTAPVISLNGSSSIDTEYSLAFTDPGATATDNFDQNVSVQVSGNVDINTLGSYTLTYSAQDSEGNSSSVQRTVNVVDTTNPVITLVGNSTISLEIHDIYTEQSATATDLGYGDISGNIITTGVVNTSAVGTYIITYSITDSSSNFSSVQRNVVVSDTTDPVITLLGDNPLEVSHGSAYVEAGATALDNRDGDRTAHVNISGSVNTNALGSYTITYSVSDTAGNATSVQRIVNVVDNTNPVITLLGDNPLAVSHGGTYVEAGATALDAVDGDLTSSLNISGSVDTNSIGAYTITYTIQDTSGNFTSAQRIINVVDNSDPVITLLGDNPLEVSHGSAYVEAGATALDAVDGNLTSSINVSGAVDINSVATYTITYTVQDTAGNSHTLQRTVNVVDNTNPVITLIGDNPLEVSHGGTYVEAGATANDNVDGDLTSSIVITGTVDANTVGSYTLNYSVQDAAGNSHTLQRTVNVVDNANPVITLLGDNPLEVSHGGSYVEAGATASDNVDGDLTSSINVSGTVDANTVGPYIITYSVSDSNGNSHTLQRTVNVVDSSNPVITLLGDNPLEVSHGGAYVESGATALDAVDGDLTANIVITGTVDANTVGPYIITYSVSDSNGNSDSIQRTVNVVDNTDPVVTLLGANPLDVSHSGTYIEAGATANDNVDGDLTSSINISGTVDANTVGSYIISYAVQDTAGNTHALQRTVNVLDTTSPVLTILGDNPLEVSHGGTYVEAGATATDAVDGDLTSSINVSGTVDANTVGSYTLNYSVQDAAGNSHTLQRTVNVVDNTNPVITLLGDNPLEVSHSGTYIEAGATANDNVDGDLTSSINISGTVDVNSTGTYTLTYTIQDAAGNSHTLQRTVNVVDNANPVLTLIGDNPLEVSHGGAYVESGATALDAVDGDLTSSINISGTVDANTVGSYTLNYSVQDTAGNSHTLQRTVNVVDNTNPVLTLIGDNPLEVSHGGTYVEAGATANDNVDGDLTSSINISGTVDPNTVGSYTLTYSVSDSAGNTSSAQRTVNVVDNSDPVITLLGDNPLEVSHGSTYVEAGATALDAVDGNLTSSINTTGTVDTNTVATYTITYSVQDTAGNSHTLQRTVNVVDNTNPVLTLIGDNPLEVSHGSSYVEAGATALDAVDGDLTSSIVITGTVDANTVGSYTITYNVQDAAGNSHTLQRTVNVVDNANPVITLLGDNPLEVSHGGSYVEAGATATDAVDGNLTSSIIITGTVDANTLGVYIITYSVSDSNGNSHTLQRTVNVVDNTNPVITLLGDNPQQVVHQDGTYIEAGATANDNVDGDLTADIQTSGTVDPATLGTYIVSYTVDDASGNTHTLQRTVNVVDATGPVITLTDGNALAASHQYPFTDPGATATDFVDGDLTSSIVVTGSVDTNTLGDHILTYTVSDAAGNVSVAQRTVTVSDNTAPVITLIGNANLTVSHQSVFTDPGATANDIVDGDLTSSIVVSGSVNTSIIGVYTLTYSVIDANSNQDFAQRTITVTDTTPPTITLLGSIPLDVSHGGIFADPGATATDAVDGNLTTNIVVSGTVDTNTVGSYILIYTVTDAHSNTASSQRTVNVVDNTDPVITLLGDDPLDVDYQATFTDPGATATDAVDGDLTSSIVVTGSVDTNTIDTYTLTYTVQDANGNSTSVQRTVNVLDALPPVITILGSNPATVLQGQSYTDAGATANDNIDGDLTSNIVSSGSVNTFALGSYQITYTVSDVSGNLATAQRTVNVEPDPSVLNKSIFYAENYKIHRINVIDPQDNEVFIDPADYSFSQAFDPYYFEGHLYLRGRVGSDYYVFAYDIDNDTMTQLFSTTHEIVGLFEPKVINGTHLVFPATEKNGTLEDIALVDASGSITIYDLNENIYTTSSSFFILNGKAYFGGLGTNYNSFSIDTSGNILTNVGFSIRSGKTFEHQNYALVHGRDTSHSYHLYLIDSAGTASILVDEWSTSSYPYFGISAPNYAVISDGSNIFTVDNTASFVTNISDIISVPDRLENAIIINDKILVRVPDIVDGIEVSSFVLAPGPTEGDFAKVQSFNPGLSDNDFTYFRDSIENGGPFVGIANNGSAVDKALYQVDSLTGGFLPNMIYDPLPDTTTQTFEMKEIFHKDGLTFFYSIQDDGTYSILSVDSSFTITVMESGITLPEGFTYYPGPF